MSLTLSLITFLPHIGKIRRILFTSLRFTTFLMSSWKISQKMSYPTRRLGLNRAKSGTCSITSRRMLRWPSSINWKNTMAVSWRTVWAWARPSRHWQLSNIMRTAINQFWYCAPRSCLKTGIPTRVTISTTPSLRIACVMMYCIIPTCHGSTGNPTELN